MPSALCRMVVMEIAPFSQTSQKMCSCPPNGLDAPDRHALPASAQFHWSLLCCWARQALLRNSMHWQNAWTSICHRLPLSFHWWSGSFSDAGFRPSRSSSYTAHGWKEGHYAGSAPLNYLFNTPHRSTGNLCPAHRSQSHAFVTFWIRRCRNYGSSKTEFRIFPYGGYSTAHTPGSLNSECNCLTGCTQI